jgi:hypothetical protein
VSDILRPARFVQVTLLFQVPPDPRSDAELSQDVNRSVSVSLSGLQAQPAGLVMILDQLAGQAQLAHLQRLAGMAPGGVNQ